MIDELLQKPYWIVDILPERVEKLAQAEGLFVWKG